MKRVLLVLCIAGLVAPPAAEAAFPGGNGKIAFAARDSGGSFSIFTAEPDGSGRASLTADDPGLDLVPHWSPDGTRLTYTAGNAFTTFDVGVMAADGSGKERLTDTSTQDIGPSWSPDGAQIVFASDRDATPVGQVYDFELWTMNADGSDATPLTENPVTNLQHVAPAWSPDGSRVAFASGFAGARDIEVVEVSTGARTTLTASPGDDDDPSWSPDGSKIAFASERDGDFEIYVMNPDGSGTQKVTDNEVDDEHPAWSPDGTRFAFERSAPSTSGESVPDIFVSDVDGGGAVNLTNTLGMPEHQPDWQPLNRRPDCTSVRATPAALGAPNHRLRPVTLSGATDPDGDAVDLGITGVTQDEPVTGPRDAVATTIAHRVRLRAERDPHGDGRVYRIAFEASDGRGGTCTGFATAGVRKGSQAPVDSAPPSYDSFGS